MELGKANPTVKLLYVTPEQLVKGERLKATLTRLRDRVSQGLVWCNFRADCER